MIGPTAFRILADVVDGHTIRDRSDERLVDDTMHATQPGSAVIYQCDKRISAIRRGHIALNTAGLLVHLRSFENPFNRADLSFFAAEQLHVIDPTTCTIAARVFDEIPIWNWAKESLINYAMGEKAHRF